MVLSQDGIIQKITSFSSLDLNTKQCIVPVQAREDKNLIRPCKKFSRRELRERQAAIELYEKAVSDGSHDAISENIRDLLECCFCYIHNDSRFKDDELIDAICNKWKEELSIRLQNEEILYVSSAQRVVSSKVSETIEICELPCTTPSVDTDKYTLVTSLHESQLVEETTTMTTFSSSITENTVSEEEYQATASSVVEASVEGVDSEPSSAMPQYGGDSVRSGTDEDFHGDERDLGEQSTIVIEMDSQIVGDEREITADIDNQDSTLSHGRPRRHRLSMVTGLVDQHAKKVAKKVRRALAEAGKRAVAKLEESDSDVALEQKSAAAKTLNVNVNLKLSSSTNLPLRPLTPMVPDADMDARQQDSTGPVKLNIETKIQAVASC